VPSEPIARRGTVYLVGAGPGDPGLITVRGRDLLAAADVVAHDALVPPAILALARPGAELLPVGRRHGGGPTSYRLHPAVIARAAAGAIVVRLKAGDPLVFGRGGEEAEELAAAGVRFEIVPGISAALGAAAYAGIPLTHRGCASDVTFASGHDADGSHASRTDWAAAARATGTLVLFMAGKALAANLARLVAGGRAPGTPAAYIAAATTPDQRVVTGTLATLAEQVALAALDRAAPGLVVIGDVVRLRERLAWFAPEPLAGCRLVVGRARPGPSALAAELRALGAEVVEAPEIEVAALDDTAAVDATLGAALDAAAARIALACAAGVDAAVAAARRIGRELGAPIAIGAEAAAALDGHGVAPALRIRGACRDALRDHAGELTAGPLVLITGDAGRDSLRAELAALGARVTPVVAYRTVARTPALPPGGAIDAVVLASSSCARGVLAGPLGEALRDVPAVVIGPHTEAAARDAGVREVRRAARDDVAALVDAVVGFARERRATPAAVPALAAAAPAPGKDRRGLVVVYTGQGKGKTTAALGTVFRALGRGMKVAVVQFIKGKWKTGERLYAETLPELTFLVMGKGFTWNSDDLSRDRAAAQAAWATAKQLIGSGANAMVILDEITYAINYGFIELADVLVALADRPPHVHVIATGRNAPGELCALADLVTDMTAVKHPFERGVPAQPGLDY